MVVSKDSDYRDLSNRLWPSPKSNLDSKRQLIRSLGRIFLRDRYDLILAFEQDPDRAIIELP